jgi:hypothetical protein
VLWLIDGVFIVATVYMGGRLLLFHAIVRRLHRSGTPTSGSAAWVAPWFDRLTSPIVGPFVTGHLLWHSRPDERTALQNIQAMLFFQARTPTPPTAAAPRPHDIA